MPPWNPALIFYMTFSKVGFLYVSPCIIYLVTYCTPKTAEHKLESLEQSIMNSYKSTCSFSDMRKWVSLNSCTSSSICQLRILFSVHLCDIFWIALMTLEGEDFAIPYVFQSASAGRWLKPVTPSSCLPHPEPDDTWQQARPVSFITWAKLQKFIPDLFLTVYWFPGLLCKGKTLHRSILT